MMCSKIEEKKAARIIQEKKDELEREKERRERGKGIEETEEHRNKLQKQREALKIKKEKEASCCSDYICFFVSNLLKLLCNGFSLSNISLPTGCNKGAHSSSSRDSP